MNNCVNWLSSAPVVAVSTLLGIISFFTSAYAAFKSKQIDKTLSKYKYQQAFESEQENITDTLHQFVDVINSDDMSEGFVYDIVSKISSINNTYKSILNFQTRFNILMLLQYLKKPYPKINLKKLSYKISILKGLLDKKEV